MRPERPERPEQQQIETIQNMKAAAENATASQSTAIILVPTASLISYGFKIPSKAPTRVENKIVDVMAARMEKSREACERLVYAGRKVF